MERLLVAGGSGFIGTNFIEFMLENYKSIKLLNIEYYYL